MIEFIVIIAILVIIGLNTKFSIERIDGASVLFIKITYGKVLKVLNNFKALFNK